MKHSNMLTITSLLSVLLFTFHLTDDIARGVEPGESQTCLGGVSSWSIVQHPEYEKLSADYTNYADEPEPFNA
jgi:hypothetical protein